MKSNKWMLLGLMMLGASLFIASCEDAASDTENAQYLIGGAWVESDENASGDYVENTLELDDEYYFLDHAVGDEDYSAYEGEAKIGTLTADVTDSTAAGTLEISASENLEIFGTKPLVATASALDNGAVPFSVEFTFFEESFEYIDSTYDDNGDFVESDTFYIDGIGVLNLSNWYSTESEFITVIFADEPTEEDAGKAMPTNYFIQKNLPGKSVSFLTPKYYAKKHGFSKVKAQNAASKAVKNIQKKLAH